MKVLISADLFSTPCGKRPRPDSGVPVVYGGGNRTAYRPFASETAVLTVGCHSFFAAPF